MGLAKKLLVKPGSKPKLSDIDPGFHHVHETEEAAKEDLAKNEARMGELQQKLYGEKKHALLVVLQGIDAAGKDGVCWHVIRGMDPQGTDVVGFKQPTPDERIHDFLWRVHKHTPGQGQVAVFNRSHYEDVLVARVHGLVPKSVWKARYGHINNFEALLADSGVTILKFFLYISPDEQLARFKERLENPEKQWKISDADYKEREFWDQYIDAYEDMLCKCSTAHAPWYVIPSNHKWFRNLAVSTIIVEALENLKMKLPDPTVDLDQIRRDFHKAEAEGGAPGHPADGVAAGPS